MFIDDLMGYIEDNTSLEFGVDLFIGNLPEGINNCVVMQQGNTDNQYEFGDKLGYFTSNIIFRVRGDQTENATRSLAESIQALIENLTYDFTNYYLVRGAFETPMYQLDGTDNNNNYIYVGIYSCIVERN